MTICNSKKASNARPPGSFSTVCGCEAALSSAAATGAAKTSTPVVPKPRASTLLFSPFRCL